jgi:hypothetical protein
LILRKFLSFILSLQARTRGRAAIHGRVAAMQKNVALLGPEACRAKARRSIECFTRL